MQTPVWLETMYFYLLDFYFFHFLLKIFLILGILIIVSTHKTESFLYCDTFQALLTHDISHSKQYLITDVELSLHLLNLLKWRASNDMVVSHFWKFVNIFKLYLSRAVLQTLCIFTQLTTSILDTANKNVLRQFGYMCS